MFRRNSMQIQRCRAYLALTTTVQLKKRYKPNTVPFHLTTSNGKHTTNKTQNPSRFKQPITNTPQTKIKHSTTPNQKPKCHKNTQHTNQFQRTPNQLQQSTTSNLIATYLL